MNVTMQHLTATLLVIALVAGGTAGAFAAVFLAPPPVGAEEPSGQAVVSLSSNAVPSDVAARMEAIEDRLAELEMVPVLVRQPVSPDPVATRASVVARLAKMEESVAALKAAAKSRVLPSGHLTAARQDREPTDRSLRHESARFSVLDPTLGDDAKLIAWRELRSAEIWGDDVVLEMIRIGQSSQDPSIRADVWRQAHGRDRNELLVLPMMDAMRNDLNSRVRAEATETLADYKDRTDVLAALQFSAANDPDERVRREALESLGSD